MGCEKKTIVQRGRRWQPPSPRLSQRSFKHCRLGNIIRIIQCDSLWLLSGMTSPDALHQWIQMPATKISQTTTTTTNHFKNKAWNENETEQPIDKHYLIVLFTTCWQAASISKENWGLIFCNELQKQIHAHLLFLLICSSILHNTFQMNSMYQNSSGVKIISLSNGCFPNPVRALSLRCSARRTVSSSSRAISASRLCWNSASRLHENNFTLIHYLHYPPVMYLRIQSWHCFLYLIWNYSTDSDRLNNMLVRIILWLKLKPTASIGTPIENLQSIYGYDHTYKLN